MKPSCYQSSVHLLSLSSQARDTSSAFTSRVKTRSTPCDPSPRPCPPPWCPPPSGPCWSSREQRGRRGNRTTWTLTSIFKSTATPSSAGGDDCFFLFFKSVKSLNSEEKHRQTDQSGQKYVVFNLFMCCCCFSLCVVELLGFLLRFSSRVLLHQSSLPCPACVLDII